MSSREGFLEHEGLCHLESRFDRKLSTFSKEKDTESRAIVGCDWIRWAQKAMGLGHKI